MKMRGLLAVATIGMAGGSVFAQASPTLPPAVSPTPAQIVPYPIPVNPAVEQDIALLRARITELERRLAIVEMRQRGVTEKPKSDPKAPQYVAGQIIVVGNERTPSEVITRQLRIYPGRTFTEDDLRQAERRLIQMNLFEVNPVTGVRPTLSILPSSRNPKAPVDILVHVHEP